MPIKRPFGREQRATVISAMLAFVLILVGLQLWLLVSTMNAYLGGDDAIVWPAAFASLFCFLLNAGLLVYLRKMERPRG